MQSPSAGANVTTKVHVLESDGVCRYIFPYLLKMQKQLRAVRETRESLGLPPLELGRIGPPPQPGDDDDSNGLCFFPAIPETVVYEHDFPQAWYTYDAKTKELSKQCGKYLDVMEIFKGFSVVHQGCGDVCAQFIGIQRGGACSSSQSVRGGSNAASTDGSFRAPTSDGGGDSTEVLYFTPETLLAWLREKAPQRPKEGLLQAFVPPRGERNDCLQILWSPNTSLLLRRANKHPLHSMRLDGRTRCATFDAAPHLVEETVGNVLVRQQIEASLHQVSQYLLKAEHKVVSRMVMHLKYDRDGVLWMLYATSVRVENSEVIGTCVVRDPADLESFYHQPTSTCSNDAIDTALRFQTTMTPLTERWKHFNTVHHIEGNNSNRFSMRGLQRRDTKMLLSTASQWSARSTSTAAPVEIKQLGCFIEDTLYTLYAARMTTHRSSSQAFDVLVQLPRRLQEFLDVHGTEQLLVNILGMEAAEAANTATAQADRSDADLSQAMPSMGAVEPLPPGLLYRFLSNGAKTQRPLSIVRSECEEFLAQVKAMYTA